MICKHCNQNNWDDAVFCTNCKQPLTSEPSPSQGESQAPPQPTADNSYNPYGWDSYYANPDGIPSPDPTPSKKNKKLLILIPAILAVVALVGFLGYRIFLSLVPEYRVVKAISNTVAELTETLEKAETFHNISETLKEYQKNASFAVDFSLNQETYYSSNDIRVSLVRDQKEKLMRADVSYSDGNSTNFNFTVSADANTLKAQMLQLNNNIYTIPLETFGADYTGSSLSSMLQGSSAGLFDINKLLESLSIDLFAKSDFQTFRKESDTFDNFVKSLDVEKVDQTIYGLSNTTVYRTTIDMYSLTELYNEYQKFSISQVLGDEAVANMEALGDSLSTTGLLGSLMGTGMNNENTGSLVLFFGINKANCLTAVSGYMMSDPTNTIGVVLNGKDNIWDEVLCYEGNEIVGGITVMDTASGFSVSIFGQYRNERETYVSVECNDFMGKLSFYDEDRYETFAVNYTLSGENIFFGMELPDEDMSISLSLSPERDIPPLVGAEVPILNMKLEDYIEIVSSIVQLFY